ncbi:aldo/keto reductase [Aureimonas glaciei]|uniref:Oxidoreductase n=1 Tax=Aureimonas glaciei TaxID=1776957 RepID=A0A916V249_9HYPH|nr:aldo/keto reductase [Aureimonas glaciei]GGD03069.1 oxidoreductase [Aureimonas glaciei]
MEFDHRRVGSTDLTLPVYGFGGAPLGNLFRPIPDDEAEDLVTLAVAAGHTFIDTAPFYGSGLSERRVGAALRRIDRAKVVLSTKVGRLLRPDASHDATKNSFFDASPFRPDFDYSYDGVMRSFEDSLQRLGTDHVEILFIHDIGKMTHGDRAETRFRDAMEGGYRALDELRAGGAVKAIGLGVNEWQVCEDAMDHGHWDVFLLAGRYTLLEQTALDSFLPRCISEKVSIVVGGAFNSGILATGAVEGATYNYAPAPAEIRARVDRIEAICRAHGVPMAAAALQFPLTHPAVASVIPGIAAREHIGRNRDLIDTAVPSALWSDLKSEGVLRADAPVPG